MKKTSKIMQTFRSISVVDKFLLCFLLLFMAQMAYGLFTDRLLSPSTGTIDAVVRTFASAVFGYFLSGNTGKARTFSSARGVAASLPVGRGNAPKGAIGFTDGTGSETVPLSAQIADGGSAVSLRVVIVGGVGLISLVLLLAVRNAMPVTDTMIAPITQLRDMLSSSIGYLVGSKD